MFNAYDIRGIYNKDFDKNTAYKIGYFLKHIVETDKIAICRDVRESSDEIFEYLSKGIIDSGCDVYDFGVTTTPMSYYISVKRNFNITVMITASHNPKEYNGFKISASNALPIGFDNGLNKLKDLVENEQVIPSENKGKILKDDITAEYAEFIFSKVKFKNKIKAVIDCSGGAACSVAEKIFKDRAQYIFNAPDGSFTTHNPNPMLPESRVELSKKVREICADVGIIFDGDADRVCVVDNNGNFISPDLIICLLSFYLLDGKTKEKVIMDVRSSKSCSYYVRDMGSTSIVWKVGHAYAKRRMRDENAILGGELAGHYYFRDFFYCDSGMLAATYILNAVNELKREGIRLSDIIQEFTLFSHSGEINFTVSDKIDIMNRIRDHYNTQEYMKFYDFDGIRFDFDDWWFSLRCSNTEPYLRLVVEAETKDLMNKKIKEITDMINCE